MNKREVLDVRTGFFVCVAMISVKSKYGSCSGSCTGFINDKQSKFYKVKIMFLFYLYININLYIKESSVCWYGGLSCKLND